MTPDRSKKPDAHVPVTRGIHRFFSRYFSKLRGITGGSILVFWLFGGIILSYVGHGAIRILGFLLLILFVAVYIFIAYCRPDDDA